MNMEIEHVWKTFDKLKLATTLPDSDSSDSSVCRACGKTVFETDINEGYRVCKHCGVVGDINVDPTAEWRCFTLSNGTKDASAARCGPAANPFFPEGQLSTMIGGTSKQRLQKVHQWNSVTTKERNITQAAKEFEQVAGIGQLGQRVVNTALELYVGVYNMIEQHKSASKRCSHRQGLKAACVYFACKQTGCPRERKELAGIFGVEIKVVTKGINLFMDIMGSDFIELAPLRAEDFIPRYCTLLELPFSYQTKSLAVMEALTHVGFDMTPPNLAAGALFFVSQSFNGLLTKELIHDRCGTSLAVIGRSYHLINQYRKDILEFLASKETPEAMPEASLEASLEASPEASL